MSNRTIVVRLYPRDVQTIEASFEGDKPIKDKLRQLLNEFRDLKGRNVTSSNLDNVTIDKIYKLVDGIDDKVNDIKRTIEGLQ